MPDQLILKRSYLTHAGFEDYDIVCDGKVVGRIYKESDQSWFWGLAYGYHKDRTPTHGYVGSRDEAMTAFRRSWDRT